MKVREARLTDLKNLSVLFNSYRMFYGKKSDIKVAEEFLRSRIEEKDSKIFVCDFNNELSGFVQLYPIFSSTRVSKYWLLNDLYVDVKKRGKGYSKLLIEKSKELVVESKACGMMLETEKSNIIGNKLYPSSGFKKNELCNFYEWIPS